MTGLIDLQEPPGPQATAPLTIWLLRYWNRHTGQVTLFASYQADLAEFAAGVRSSWDNVRFDDGVPSSPDGHAAAVAIYCGQVPDGQPLTSGERGVEGFNRYADTVAGAPAGEVQLRAAALRVVDDDPDVPLSVLPTYVMQAHGIQVSVRAQAWRLVQALVSLDGWQFWLQGRFAATVTSARRALRRRLTMPRWITAEPAKGAR